MAGMRSWEMPAGSNGIEAALTVTCRRKRMVAHLRKDILSTYGYSTAKPTLRDPQCKAESNRSHFLLNSPLTSCGTLRLVDQDAAPSIVLYQNSILLRRPHGASLHSNGSTDTQQAMEEDTKVINFTCVYPVLLLPRSNDLAAILDRPRTSRPLINLEVYSTHISSKHPGPCMVASNSRVFVEVFLSPLASGVGFSLHLCFVSPSSDPWVQSEFLLVCAGCAADSTVTFSTQRPANKEHQRFSFRLHPVYNESIQFLHCRLALHAGHGGAESCTKEEPDEPGTSSENTRVAACVGTGERANRSHIRIISKPMIVTMGGDVGVTGDQATPSTASGWKPRMMKDERPSDVHVGLLQTAQVHQGLGLEAIVGIVFAAFVIGALLMAGLWFIYSKTGEPWSLASAENHQTGRHRPKKTSSWKLLCSDVSHH
ncbi:transforming growth factor-beta receptor type 3-like protein isoform X2 [Ambystoma mexicanum]